MKKTICLEGKHIHDISSFYAEINRVLMPNEDWKIGHSLDALNDLMYGGFGEIKQNERVQLVWKNIEQSKASLGLEATQTYYHEKLKNPSVFNIRLIEEKLTSLEKGDGPTFYEIVVDIISSHPNIKFTEA